MSAVIVVDLSPIDKDKLQQYSAAAMPTIKSFQGEFLSKGKIQSLTSEDHHEIKALIQFPDEASAIAWYQSPEYQALIPLREQAMTASFHLIKQ